MRHARLAEHRGGRNRVFPLYVIIIGFLLVGTTAFLGGGRAASAASISPACVAAPAPTYSPQWSNFGRDSAHAGNTEFVGPSSPSPKWMDNSSTRMQSGLVIGANGTVYSTSDFLNATNPDGTLRWSWPSTNLGFYTPPTIGPSGTIYAGDSNDNIDAVSADGHSLWNYSTTVGVAGGITVSPTGTIYAMDQAGNLLALAPNGNLLWEYASRVTLPGSATPAIGTGGTIYVAAMGGIFAVSPSGTLNWDHLVSANSGAFGTPVIGPDGTVYTYLNAPNDTLYAFSPTGAVKWTVNANLIGPPTVGPDGTIYLGNYYNLTAVAPTGAQKWAIPLLANQINTVAVDANGTIYATDYGNNIFSISPSGAVNWTYSDARVYSFQGFSPVLSASGTLYIQGASNAGPNFIEAVGPSDVPVTITLHPSAGSTPISQSNHYTAYFYSGSAPTTVSLTGGTQSITVDPYTKVNISSSTTASTASEQWCFADYSPTSPSLLTFSSKRSGNTVSYYYYDLLSQSVSYTVKDGGAPAAPAISYSDAPTAPSASDSPHALSLTLASTPAGIWARRGSIASVPDPINGATGERWAVGSSTATFSNDAQWTLSAADQIDNPIRYYHQYSVTWSYTVSDSTAVTPAVTLSGTQNGTAVTRTAQGTVWLDATTTASVPSVLPSSPSNQRWATAPGVSTSITVSATSDSLSVEYFHQFMQTLSYSLVGGGTPNPPTASGVQYGSPYSPALTTAPTGYWFDANGQIAFTNPIAGATGERWYSTNSSVSSLSDNTAAPAYYHQYSQSVSFTVDSGVGYSSPTLTYVSSGTTSSLTLTASPQSLWADAGTTASATNPLSGSNSSIRWGAPSAVWTVSSAGVIPATLRYQLQYAVSFQVIGGGTTDPSGAGWYPATSSVSIVATPSAGDQFVNWASNSSMVQIADASLASTSMLVNGPGMVTANFTGSTITTTTTTSTSTSQTTTSVTSSTTATSTSASSTSTSTSTTAVPEFPVSYGPVLALIAASLVVSILLGARSRRHHN